MRKGVPPKRSFYNFCFSYFEVESSCLSFVFMCMFGALQNRIRGSVWAPVAALWEASETAAAAGALFWPPAPSELKYCCEAEREAAGVVLGDTEVVTIDPLAVRTETDIALLLVLLTILLLLVLVVVVFALGAMWSSLTRL